MLHKSTARTHTQHVRTTIATTLLAALTGLGCASAQAAGELPRMHEEGALQYSCGGIGVDESTAMRAAMKDYPLSLLFAAKDGDYLADISVVIKGGKEEMQFKADGPVCLLKLPSGQYSVQATAKNGKSQSQQVNVGAKGSHTLDFRF